jgi:hypothetical protein
MSAAPRSDSPSLAPLLMVVGLAVLGALGASVMLIMTAQTIAKRNAGAEARADSLAREVAALRESLAVASAAREASGGAAPPGR